MKKIAYLILCHKNAKQIIRFIESLADSYADVYVHVDKKNDELYNVLQISFDMHSNVRILKERVAVSWGNFSQIQAILALIRNMLRAKIDYSYVSLVSGQDLLLKPHIQFYEFLNSHYPIEFVEIERRPEFDARINTFQINSGNCKRSWIRFINYCFRYMYDKCHIGIRKFKPEEIYKGGEWWTLTRDCLLKVIDYIDDNPAFVKKFRYTLCSDEHFMQMLIVKVGLLERAQNNNLRYIDWKNCKDNPRVLLMEDLPRIWASSDFIGRKFDMDEDSVVIDKLLKYSREKV